FPKLQHEGGAGSQHREYRESGAVCVNPCARARTRGKPSVFTSAEGCACRSFECRVVAGCSRRLAQAEQGTTRGGQSALHRSHCRTLPDDKEKGKSSRGRRAAG